MKPSKFGNKPVTIDGIKFHSMLEGAFYQKCKAWKAEGKIYDFKMQVPFVLHGGIKYKLDFQIEMPERPLPKTLLEKVSDHSRVCIENGEVTLKRNSLRYVEVKGYWTQTAKLKKKLFEADYGKLEIHSKDSPWRP